MNDMQPYHHVRTTRGRWQGKGDPAQTPGRWGSRTLSKHHFPRTNPEWTLLVWSLRSRMDPEWTLKSWMNLNGSQMEPERTLKLWMDLNGTWMEPEWNLKSWMEPEWIPNGSWMKPEIPNTIWTDPEWTLNRSWNPERNLNGPWMDPEILNGPRMEQRMEPTVIPWESQGLTLSHGPWKLILHNKYIYIYIYG